MSVPTPAPPTRFAHPPFWRLLALAAVLVLADQQLKSWAISHLQPHTGVTEVIPGLLGWYLTFNTGAAWSMFSGATKVLAVGRIVVSLGILGYLWKRPPSAWLSVPLTLIAAGALGNAIDGLRNGQVTDMIYSPLLSQVTRALGKGDFPIYNLADMCVVGGTIALLLVSLLGKDGGPDNMDSG